MPGAGRTRLRRSIGGIDTLWGVRSAVGRPCGALVWWVRCPADRQHAARHLSERVAGHLPGVEAACPVAGRPGRHQLVDLGDARTSVTAP